MRLSLKKMRQLICAPKVGKAFGAQIFIRVFLYFPSIPFHQTAKRGSAGEIAIVFLRLPASFFMCYIGGGKSGKIRIYERMTEPV